MKINKKRIEYLNTLMTTLKENRGRLIDTISKYVCPKKVEECDNQLEENMEAKSCKYFPLCNVLGSYSLQLEEDQEEIDKVLQMFYDRMEDKKSINESLFS